MTRSSARESVSTCARLLRPAHIPLPSPALSPLRLQLYERLLEGQFTGIFALVVSLGLSAWAVRAPGHWHTAAQPGLPKREVAHLQLRAGERDCGCVPE